MNKFYTKTGLFYVITSDDRPAKIDEKREQAQPDAPAEAKPHVSRSIMQSTLSAITQFLARH